LAVKSGLKYVGDTLSGVYWAFLRPRPFELFEQRLENQSVFTVANRIEQAKNLLG
jgi:hypothetical protein